MRIMHFVIRVAMLVLCTYFACKVVELYGATFVVVLSLSQVRSTQALLAKIFKFTLSQALSYVIICNFLLWFGRCDILETDHVCFYV